MKFCTFDLSIEGFTKMPLIWITWVIVTLVLAKSLLKLYEMPHLWPVCIQFIPLSVFWLYARYFNFTPEAWQGAFYCGGVLALLIYLVFWSRNIVFDSDSV